MECNASVSYMDFIVIGEPFFLLDASCIYYNHQHTSCAIETHMIKVNSLYSPCLTTILHASEIHMVLAPPYVSPPLHIYNHTFNVIIRQLRQ